MIKLCVEEYCHDCPRFEPEIKKDSIYYDGGLHPEVVIFCELRHECASIKRHIEKKMKEKKNESRTSN